MKIFGRELALFLPVALGALQMVSILMHLSPGQQNALSVLATAVYGVILAVVTRPWQPSAITGGITTILTAIVALGVHISPNLISALNAFAVALFTLILTLRVSPAHEVVRPADPRQ